MAIYAWCNSLLKDHSIGTVRVSLTIPKLNRISEVIALKIQRLGSNVSLNEAREIVLMSLALHDIGKACSNYQGAVKVMNGKCRASFKYHEVISAVLVAEALSNLQQLSEPIKCVITLAILNHHYVMRTLKINSRSYYGFINDVLKSSGSIMREAADVLKEISMELDLRSPLVNDVINHLAQLCSVDLRNALMYLIAGIAGRPGGYKFLEHEPVSAYYLASALAGLINISDSISAHCERGGNNVFVESILKELGASCNTLFNH